MMPMVAALVPFALGIFFWEQQLFSPWGMLSVAALLVVVLLMSRRWLRLMAIAALLFVGGALLHSTCEECGTVCNTHLEKRDEGLAAWQSLHNDAVTRLSAAWPDDEARGVVLAMVTGSRAGIDGSQRTAYAAGGASHLLAVSGLHVGILFLLVNLLVCPLALFRYGNILRSVAILALTWSFVALCGFAPSAVRAAVMFSTLQLMHHSLRDYSSGNVLAATAFVMLLCDPHLLFNISFALSFISVAAIIFWGMPLCRALQSRYTLLNIFTSSVIISVAATLATMPLVSSLFGMVSIVGVVLNPIVVLTSYVIVLFGLLSLLFPPLGLPAYMAAEFQNRLVHIAASIEGGHLQVRMSDGAVVAAYMMFIVLTLLLWSVHRKKRMKFTG